MVKVQDITFAYSGDRGNVLEKISFDIQQNQCIAVLGNNGAGKSTLLKCIDRICPAQEGLVLVGGEDIFQMSKNQLARQISYVSQNQLPLETTVFDAILLGRKPYIKWDAREKDRQIVADIMRQMDLEDFALRRVAELSGGERQKIMLARALAQEPRLLLLDEPTSNLDPRNQHEVLRMVKEIAQSHGICVLMVLHDLNLALRYCDRFLFLKDARVFAYGGLESMTPQHIQAVYGMEAEITEYRGIPVIIPFPEEGAGLEEAKKVYRMKHPSPIPKQKKA